MHTPQSINRRNDIDWLRVLATGTIFFYHCARFFNPSDWHVKNNRLSEAMGVFVGVVGQWIMPLFFILSAMAAYYALASRNNRQFVWERSLRLAIPFLFGTFCFIIPVQVYIERVSHGDFSGSLFAFYPHYFEGWYAFGGNFAWMGLHLWYLEMLFVFSLLLLPVFRLLNSPAVASGLNRILGNMPSVLAFAIPVSVIGVVELLVNQHPETYGQRSFGGWSPATYLVIFLLGYIICTRDPFLKQSRRLRFGYLLAGLTATSVGYYMVVNGVSTFSPMFSLLRGLNTWCWLCAIMGFGAEHLTDRTPFLRQASRAVLPFYILHQTVIVIIGFWIRQSHLIIPVKFFLLATSSFLIIVLIYAMVIRPVRGLHILMGMKGSSSAMPSQQAAGYRGKPQSASSRPRHHAHGHDYGIDAQ